jgi:DNA-binding CsgD family transcriptional regulator
VNIVALMTDTASGSPQTVVEGRALKEAADLCGITHNTAKSQLKSIFLKTNVRHQVIR